VPHPSERSAAEPKNLLLDPLRKGSETTEAHLDRKDSGRKRASSLQINIIDKAPPPILPALGGLNQRMLRFVEMRSRMTAR
jgi:hypothetical protein